MKAKGYSMIDMRKLFMVGSLLVSALSTGMTGCTSENVQTSDRSTNEDLMVVAQTKGYAFRPVSRKEGSILHAVSSRQLRSVVLMRDDDRVAAAFWFSDPDAKGLMDMLTAYTFDLLSKDVQRLTDEPIHRNGFAPIDLLAFTDPALSEERMVFAKIRDSLYEFHVSEEKEGWVQGLLLEIARE